ncbi:MAG: hypothetical protein MUF15_08815 [Acidobacteria bacterium]|nr:hypothetical protein [Acidobacteriota bacterium]
MKLEVTAPNNLKETNRYNYFYYFQSNFNVGLGPINSSKYLIPGASYTIPIKIQTPPIDAFRTYDVKNGSFELLLESPTGQEVYRKEVTGINIPNGTEQTLSETFIFHPKEKGRYILKFRYWDETKEKPASFIHRQYLWHGTQISMQADKTGYNYGDMANIAVDIIGAGSYHLRFNCPEAGINEERDIQVPDGIYQINQQFQMPIGLNSSYTANVSVIDSASRETQKQIIGIDYLSLTKVFGGVGTFFQKGSDLPGAIENQKTLSRKGFLTSQSFYLELFLDNQKIHEQTLTTTGEGYSHTEITLNNTNLTGGSHLLKAVLTNNGLTSTKSTGFLYGTNLPDLYTILNESTNSSLNYTYHLTVKNSGKSTSPVTSLAFNDNDSLVETVSIPSLTPGTSHEITFNWSGSGKAGHHEFEFIIDPTNAIKEYSEGNNSLTIEEDVPFIFYNLEVEPIIWPANSDINIITRLINNQDQVTPLTLNLNITKTNTNTTIFQRNHSEELPAFGSKNMNDHFNTGVTPAGEYTLSQDVTGVSGENINLHKEIPVLIEVTKTISGSLELLPIKISAGVESEVQLMMNLKNTGNVSLEEETAVIEIVNKENQDIIKTESFVISIPLSKEITMKKMIGLNLVEGQYEVRLMFLDNQVAAAELIAAPSIKPKKAIGVHPRVLMMNLDNKNSGDASYIINMLQGLQIQCEAAAGLGDSYFKFHKGHANINVILGHMLGRKWRDELKERVWRGEGLILFCSNPLNAPDLTDWLGVSTKVFGGVGTFFQKGSDPSETIQILFNDLTGSGGTVKAEFPGKNYLILEKQKQDVVIIGQI